MQTKLFLKLLLISFIAVISSKMSIGQQKANFIEGSWLGTIKTQGIELRVIFNISKDGENGYKSLESKNINWDYVIEKLLG